VVPVQATKARARTANGRTVRFMVHLTLHAGTALPG
jgi:hypothetical protein